MTPLTEEQKAQERERQALHRAAMNRVSAAFPAPKATTRHPGTLESAKALQEAANSKLEASWLATRQGLLTMAEFKAALLEWERDQAAAIRLLKRK